MEMFAQSAKEQTLSGLKVRLGHMAQEIIFKLDGQFFPLFWYTDMCAVTVDILRNGLIKRISQR